MRYARICADFWNYPNFQELSDTEKVVYLYLRTCRNSNSAGLFWVPIAQIAIDTCLEAAKAEEAIRQLARTKMIHFDPRRHLFYIPGMIRDEVGTLKHADNRLKYLQAIYNDCLSQRLAAIFFKDNGKTYGLAKREDHQDKISKEAPIQSTVEQQIDQLMEVYNFEEKHLAVKALEAIASTRSTNKLSLNVTLQILQKWARIDREKVFYGIKVYLDKQYCLERKGEAYLLAIMKNADPDQIRRTFATVSKTTEKNMALIEQIRRKRNEEVDRARDSEC